MYDIQIAHAARKSKTLGKMEEEYPLILHQDTIVSCRLVIINAAVYVLNVGCRHNEDASWYVHKRRLKYSSFNYIIMMGQVTSFLCIFFYKISFYGMLALQ